ncbi:MAG TPA: hypothetical protein VEA19_02285 [Actinomycetota bacterium]|nr:hypothetical protein [Actinomycetota bacterium]
MKEIEQVRGRLGDQIEELEQRMPAPAKLAKRGLGVLVGGGVAGTALWWMIRRRRAKKAPISQLQRAGETVVQVIPEGWAEALKDRLEDEQVKKWALVAAGAWLAFRLAELRQLRRMNNALLAR